MTLSPKAKLSRNILFFLLFHSERAASFDQQFYQIVCEFAPEDARAFPSFMSILPDVDLARRSRAVLRAPLSAFRFLNYLLYVIHV